MANFIQIRSGGCRRLINLDWIEEVVDEGDGATIYLAFQENTGLTQDAIRVNESYDELCKKIWQELGG